MAIDYSQLAFPKGAPARVARQMRKSAKAQQLADTYDLVDKRDGLKDRVTGQTLVKGGTNPKTRLERHHIRPRSTYPELRHEADNILTVSGLVHALIEAGHIVIEGVDASLPNKLRFHWRADVPKEQRLVVIKSRRRSQQ
jgi:hypothetical protein